MAEKAGEVEPSAHLVPGVCFVSLGEGVTCLFNPQRFSPVRAEGGLEDARALLGSPVAAMPEALVALLEQHGIISVDDGTPLESAGAARERGLVLCAAVPDEVARLEREWPGIAEDLNRSGGERSQGQAADGRSQAGRSSLEVGLVAVGNGGMPLAEACWKVQGLFLESKIPALLRAWLSLDALSREVKALAQIVKPSFRYSIDCSHAEDVSEILDKAGLLVDAGFRPNLWFALSRETVGTFPEWLAELRAAWRDDFTYDLDFVASPEEAPSAQQVSELLEHLGNGTRTEIQQQGRVLRLRAILANGAGAELDRLRAKVLFATPALGTTYEQSKNTRLPYTQTPGLGALLAEHAPVSFACGEPDPVAGPLFGRDSRPPYHDHGRRTHDGHQAHAHVGTVRHQLLRAARQDAQCGNYDQLDVV